MNEKTETEIIIDLLTQLLIHDKLDNIYLNVDNALNHLSIKMKENQSLPVTVALHDFMRENGYIN